MKKLFIILMIPLLAFALPVFADDSYGDIVFYEDFETLTSPKSGVNLTATLSDAFGGGSIMLYDGGSGSSYTIDSPISDGTKMLGVGGTVQYPQIMLPNLNITKAGKYTLAYDYYIPSALTPWFMQTGLSTTRRFNYVKGSLQTVVETFEIETGSGSTIPNIFIQAGKDTTVNEYYYIDNLRLYYLGEQLPETNYGLLLDSKDFEKTGSLDESLGTGGSGVYNFGTGATFSTEIPSGVSGADNMLKVTTTTQTSASAGYANMTIKRPGTYTVVFDCYIPSDYPLGWFKLKNSIEDVTISVQKGARSTYSAQIVLEEGKTLSQIFFQSYNYGSAINGSFYVDNIKLYLEPEEYLFSDFATNLVSTFIGDAKTERGFAWTSNTKCGDMVIRYAPSGPGLSGRYEEVSGYYEEYKDRYYYKADVTGLEPGVEYTYIIGTSEMNMWSDEYNFTTQAADTEEFSFIVVTDPQGSSQSSNTIFESVINAGFEKADDASFVVSLGDMVEHGYDESLWDMYFDAFDGKCAEIPNMAVLGNHEARADIAGKNFRLHFNHPDNGHDALKNLTASDMTNVYYKELVENIEESVYSFDYGNVHFAVINTGSDWAVSTDGLKLVKAQKEWLEADLEKSKAGWKVLMLHQGLYPAKEERYWGLREVFEDIVIEYDVDLVLQGHDHMVARTYPIADDKTPVITEDTDTVEKGSGTVYFIPGAAADKRYSDLETVPEYMLKVINTSSSEPVFSAIKVSASGLLVETINLSGEVIDSFEIVDNGQGDSVKPVRERLVYEDFEDVADGTVIFNSTDCGTLTAYKNSYINATNPGTASIYKDKLFSVTRGGDLNTSYVTTLDGNKVVRVDQRTDGASKNPQIGLYGGNTNENASLGITAAGTYTLKVDFYLPAEYASKINSFFVQTNVSETYTNTFIDVDNSATEGKWYTLTTDAVLDGTKELKFFRIVADALSATSGVSFYVDNIKLYCQPDKPYLELSADSITEEGQSIAITPYVSETNLTVLSDTHYTTDSVCADLVRNADGTATLTGKINGKVTVTADFGDVNIPNASVVIDVSGQSERVAATSLKVLMFGNSILNHPPAPDIGWTGNWGMAASSADKDYARRLMYYIDQKYGSGSAEYIRGYWMAGLEGIWREHQTDPDYDYATDMEGHIKSVTDNNPDVIIIQCGENASVTNKESYINSLGQLVAAFKKAAPDAHIIICTPFWGGDAMIEGVKAVAEEYGIKYASLHVLNTPENKAPEYSHGGVANHPGDTGMDNIAKLIYAELNAVLSENSPVVYSSKPESVSISGKNEITEDFGSITLVADVFPNDAAEDVIWSVNDTNVALIDQNGVLTAISDGKVTVKAVSKYDEAVYGEYTVTVSGQSEPFTVTFAKNADENVTLPEPLKRKGTVNVSDIFAERPGYRFIGWSPEVDGDTVDTFEIKSDVTLYAKWDVADFFDFNREGFSEGFVIENGFNQYIQNGVYHAIATDTDASSGNILTVKSPVLALDSADYDSLVVDMQITDFNEGTTVELVVNTTTDDYYYSISVTSSAFAEYEFGFSDYGVEGIITGFSFVPVNMDCTVRINEIYFTKSESLKTNILRCSDGYASLVCEIDNTGYSGTNVIIAYYESDRIVKTEVKKLDDDSVNTVSSYFTTDKNIDKAQVFVLNFLKPVKLPITITKG